MRGESEGPKAAAAAAAARTVRWTIEIVKRPDAASGFEIVPKRWIVTVCTMLPSVGLNGHRSSNAEAIGGDGCSLREVQASTRVNLSQATQSHRGI